MSTGSSFEAFGSRVKVRGGSIVVRCVQFDEPVAFWQAALDYVPREPPQDGWVVVLRIRLGQSKHFVRPGSRRNVYRRLATSAECI